MTVLSYAQLDEIDLGIMAQLSDDGRRSTARIAAALGISKWVVKKHLDKLIESGACQFVITVNPALLGYGTSALARIEVELPKEAAVVAALADLDLVTWVGHTTGKSTLLAEIISPDPSWLYELVVRRISSIAGVVSVRTALILRQTYGKQTRWYLPKNVELPGDGTPEVAWIGEGSRSAGRRAGEGAPAGNQLDTLDEQIVVLLQADGRRPAADIARIAGVHTSTVTARIDRLVQRGLLQVSGFLDPTSLGFTAHHFVGIGTDPKRTAEIGEEMARVSEVFWVCYLADWHDVLVDVWVRDEADLLGFLTTKIRPIPGVRSTETMWIQDAKDWRPPKWQLPGAIRLISRQSEAEGNQ